MLTKKTNMEIVNIEKEYSKNTPIEHRKKYAQFFTPLPIAELMSKWLLGNNKLNTVLEPAFGLGIFSRILVNHKQNINTKGYETDKIIYEKSNVIFNKSPNVNIILNDYIYNDWDNKYDGIICNPPYFKFHNYDNKNALKEISRRFSIKLSGFTNLYALFLVKSIYQLNKNGRMAYIVPSEFLNSDYGENIKKILIKSKVLRHIIVINFKENVFDGVLTTSCILLCANDNKSCKVQFTNVNNLNDLGKIISLINNYPSYIDNESILEFNKLKPNIKWRAYYHKNKSKKYKNLVPFSKFAKVVRGIATGANEYFTFNISKSIKFGIDSKYLLPCICKSANVKTEIFTDKHFNTIKENDKFVFLLNTTNTNEENIKKYLKIGIEQGIHKKYLTSHRNPWYSLEKRLPAPIWVSVFNRTGLKFIRNEANISNLTTFHCIYPIDSHLFLTSNTNLLFAYLLTNTAKEIFQDNQREYGNGLKKFEPNDLNNSLIMNINLIDKQIRKIIIDLYNQYRESVIRGKPDKDIIKKIEVIFVNIFSI